MGLITPTVSHERRLCSDCPHAKDSHLYPASCLLVAEGFRLRGHLSSRLGRARGLNREQGIPRAGHRKIVGVLLASKVKETRRKAGIMRVQAGLNFRYGDPIFNIGDRAVNPGARGVTSMHDHSGVIQSI